MFGLMVRFTCKDAAAAAAFDDLVARTGEHIRAHEPGTVIYAVHRVDGRPLERVFYELYRDEDAFEEGLRASLPRRAGAVPFRHRGRSPGLRVGQGSAS